MGVRTGPGLMVITRTPENAIVTQSLRKRRHPGLGRSVDVSYFGVRDPQPLK